MDNNSWYAPANLIYFSIRQFKMWTTNQIYIETETMSNNKILNILLSTKSSELGEKWFFWFACNRRGDYFNTM